MFASNLVALGKHNYRLFSCYDDIEQELFDIAFHMKQSLNEVMAWPTRLRRAMYKKLNERLMQMYGK